MMEKSRDLILAIIASVVAFVIIILAISTSPGAQGGACVEIPVTMNAAEDTQHSLNWTNIILKDVTSGKSFRISDFKNKPVMVLSFTVPCPICTEQQQEIMKLSGRIGDAFVFVALDIDPNEDEGRIISHIRQHNFSGYYAVSPLEMTRSLVNEFGIDQITPASAPIILVCTNSSVYAFARGLKSSELLKEQLEIRC